VSRGLGDTSLFIARETGRPIDATALPDQIALSVITLGELRAGVLAAGSLIVRDRRLSTLAAALSLEVVPIDERIAETWARLRLTLRDAGQRMPANDSWIAATAIALGVPVVTQDADYNVSVEGLEVIRV
jgi:predicted nucleic acid-binding protein